jgi:hypothetical protein
LWVDRGWFAAARGEQYGSGKKERTSTDHIRSDHVKQF